jgi:hypothetical protein
MGYYICIGELRITKYEKEENNESYYTFDVAPQKNYDAPAFGEVLSDFKNERHPSYTAWNQTLTQTRLGSWLEEFGLMSGKDGVPKPITKKHVSDVNNAYTSYTSENPEITPCFDLNDKEAYLARLVWLKYWINWSYENCANPTFYWA